jgi:hypothetical protein
VAELFTEVFDLNPLIAARYLRLHTATGSFDENVKNILYTNLRDGEDSALMKEICQLAAAPRKSPNLDSIITYNFDDVLETCLARLGVEIPYQVINNTKIRAKTGTLPIYHVHGFLPRRGRISPNNKLILSEDAYHSQYSNIYDWSNLVQINKFRENTCLFIGLSFSDPNLRRLLDIAHNLRGDDSIQHYLVRKRYSEEQISKK